MRLLLELPLLVILMGVGALAMYLPALHALVIEDHATARAFFYTATLLLVLVVILGLATARYAAADPVRSQVLSLLGAYVVLPLMLAIPVAQAVGEARFLDAWFEMVSSFTTTGATLFPEPGTVPDPVHLWRGLVGWLGGFFVLLSVLALFAPRNLGGFEVLSGRPGRRGDFGAGHRPSAHSGAQRLFVFAVQLAPIYGGLTAVLAIGLLVAGDAPLVAVMHAMAILATSGISPVAGMGASGLLGEALMLVFLVFALTRRSMPGSIQPGEPRSLVDDPEFRIALWIILTVGGLLFARHMIAALAADGTVAPAAALRVFWGSIFTAASFLTTTGFAAPGWAEVGALSGLGPAGLILAGLALIGGGVATTAGGLKLLRVYALHRHGVREMERILHPASVAGQGRHARLLRREGAMAAWVYFMLYVISLVAVLALLALAGVGFEPALIFAISALTTTGPLAGVAGEGPLLYGDLGDAARVVLAAAMILGRLEILALIALVLPESWRG